MVNTSKSLWSNGQRISIPGWGYLQSYQYLDSRNLVARAQLHQRYGSNPAGWFSWVMEHIALKPGEWVLECGCGPGWLWRSNLKRNLLEYLLSSTHARNNIYASRLQEVSGLLRTEINAQGHFEIATDSGLFAATNIILA